MTTLRPSFAASSAAATPEIPAPSTQISVRSVVGVRVLLRRTVRVGMSSEAKLPSLQRGWYGINEHGARGHGLHAAPVDGKIPRGFAQRRLAPAGTPCR